MRRPRSTLAAVLVTIAVTVLTGVTAMVMVTVSTGPVAAANGAAPGPADGPRPTVVVGMGDSYLSGEGGRWVGNHPSDRGDRRGTDRAAYRNRWGFWRYSQARVYGPSSSGCHRSDVAPLFSAGIDVDIAYNLACSGASTVNLVRSANGGQTHRGEMSQADQLAIVAAEHDIEMVVVSIGGNDLGFASIILDCALDYSLSTRRRTRMCHGDQQANVDGRLPEAMEGVGRAIDEIRSVLSEADQEPGSYRLVLQSYPSPVPRGEEFRYRQGSWHRVLAGGCPFWNADATWARDELVPQISGGLAEVASEKGIEFLDLQDALQGREICAEGVGHGSGQSAEWSRFLVTGVFQGEAQESLHPNAIGQRAMGRCLALLWVAEPGWHQCATTPGHGPNDMTLASINRELAPVD